MSMEVEDLEQKFGIRIFFYSNPGIMVSSGVLRDYRKCRWVRRTWGIYHNQWIHGITTII